MLANKQLYSMEKKINLHVFVKYVSSKFSDFSHSQLVNCCIGKLRTCWQVYLYFLCTVAFTPHEHFVLRMVGNFIEVVAITDIVIVAYLKVKEGLTKPVMHDGGLSCIIMEFLPDELSHERLD